MIYFAHPENLLLDSVLETIFKIWIPLPFQTRLFLFSSIASLIGLTINQSIIISLIPTANFTSLHFTSFEEKDKKKKKNHCLKNFMYMEPLALGLLLAILHEESLANN